MDHCLAEITPHGTGTVTSLHTRLDARLDILLTRTPLLNIREVREGTD